MIKAHAGDANGMLAVHMSIARMDGDSEWHATHILRLGTGSWDHRWEAIEHPGTVQEPSLTFGHEEARALYEALGRYFGPRPRVVLNFFGSELDEKQAAKLRERVTAALKEVTA